ncbi:FtsW/RodA/SpoVE family cell cycle protein [Candidatus Cyanaurora vandensis]|uniref:FtsW/RodA/SpoVE family cell cycle protein n=1 Tax=Candidatus Cyanaurora vandensis TaxID=2714958 RepID=UPI00257EE07F|nr:putative peptidoglycan glycosyltransferase FtsW [Candidatus Cyanaurora vandensis]
MNIPTLRPTTPLTVNSITSWAPEAPVLRVMIYVWLVFGLVVLYSASLPQGLREFKDPTHFFMLQLLWVTLGVGVFETVIRTPLVYWWRGSPFLFGTVFLAVLATQWVGVELNGADRWLALGPVSLQPSEFAKPLLVLQTAWVIDRWSQLRPPAQFFWGLALVAMIGAVYTQPSLSMALLMAVVLWLMAFAGGFPLVYLVGSVGAAVAVIALKVSTTAYQMKRLTSYLDPFAPNQIQGAGYQVVQSLLAIGSGGWWGVGFGLSAQKVSFLPYPYSDFIFAVFAEEFGLVGVVGFLAFLTVFALVGLRLSTRFSAARPVRLLAFGCTMMLVVQSLMHIGVVTGLLPPTGMPLPLVSYGGSAIWAALITCGLLVRAAREAGMVRLDVAPVQRGR